MRNRQNSSETDGSVSEAVSSLFFFGYSHARKIAQAI